MGCEHARAAPARHLRRSRVPRAAALPGARVRGHRAAGPARAPAGVRLTETRSRAGPWRATRPDERCRSAERCHSLCSRVNLDSRETRSRGSDAVDLNDTPEQAAYREAVRSGSKAAQGGGAAALRLLRGRRATSTRAATWQRKLAEAGFAGVTWPKEFGGQGGGPIEQVTVNQELSAAPRSRACST